jgi:hypothetical protein
MPHAQGSTYYVATTGSDADPGTLAEPWATLQHAADMAQPGDTVHLRAGEYHEEIVLPRSGTAGQPITFAAFQGETVWLDGRGKTLNYAFDLEGASHIAVAGLNMRDYRSGCIVSWDGSSHITIRSAELHHCGDSGISLFQNAHYVTVEDVYIHHSDLMGMDCGIGPCTNWTLRRIRSLNNGAATGDTAADGIAVENGDAILVEDCEASGNAGDGFDFKSSGTVLRRVIARGNARDNIKLWGENSSLINGLSVDAGLTGLVLAEGGSYTVTHSLIANLASYGYLATLGEYGRGAPASLHMHNTIFFNDNPVMAGTMVYLSPDLTFTGDHNLYYNPYREHDVICAEFLGDCFSAAEINDGTWAAASGQESHSRYADPAFANAAAEDFRLTSASPALDAGNPAWSPSDDLDGNPRPSGPAPDIGPYELQQGGASVALMAGWSLISIPIIPDSADIGGVLDSIDGKYVVVHAWDSAAQEWRTYYPDLPPGGQTLLTLDEKTAFWILMAEAATLTVAGAPPATTAQTLHPGWNLVAYPSATARPVADALSSIAGKYSIVWGYYADETQPWRRYNPTSAFGNDLTTLQPWRGYWVKALEGCVLTIAY